MEMDKDKQGYVFINLLPYREQIKKEKLRQFSLIAALFASIGGFLIFIIYSFILVSVEQQKSRNDYINKASSKLDVEIKEIANLQNEINDTLNKRKVVERLQTNRGDSVKILNEIATQLPEGMKLTEVSSKSVGQNDVVTVKGTTNSNNKVSEYMTQLVASDVFIDPVLIEIKANVKKLKAAKGEKPKEIVNNSFEIRLTLKPSIDIEEEKKPVANNRKK